MEEVITPYITPDNKIFVYVTDFQLREISNSLQATYKRRELLRNKMSQRRCSDTIKPTKPTKPIIKISLPVNISPPPLTLNVIYP